MSKNFCISTDFSLTTIEDLNGLNNMQNNKTREVFGSIVPSEFSSGRSEIYLPKCSIEELAIYINYLHKKNIEFNYTLNGFCMSNIEFNSMGYKKLINFVSSLIDIGVDRFTISSPALMSILSTHFESIKITASAICQINSLGMARDYSDIKGVDRIVIFEDATRDFQLMRKIYKELKIEMEVIVNQPCLFGCIYRNFHRLGLSHELASGNNKFDVDNYYQICWRKKLGNISEMLKIPTIIRPEDLHYYEDAGVKHFKIVDRMIHSMNFDVVRSYLKEKHVGNFFDLLPGKFNSLYVDNSEMDGFIDYFVNGQNKCNLGCHNCGYCDTYARKVKVVSDKVEKRISSINKQVNQFLQHGPKESTDTWKYIISSC